MKDLDRDSRHRFAVGAIRVDRLRQRRKPIAWRMAHYPGNGGTGASGRAWNNATVAGAGGQGKGKWIVGVQGARTSQGCVKQRNSGLSIGVLHARNVASGQIAAVNGPAMKTRHVGGLGARRHGCNVTWYGVLALPDYVAAWWRWLPAHLGTTFASVPLAGATSVVFADAAACSFAFTVAL